MNPPKSLDGHYPFTGRIESKSGEVIYAAVEGWFDVRTHKMLSQWAGELTVTSAEQRDATMLFEGVLIVENGKRGECFATEIRFDNPVIQFRGSGPAPI